MTDALFDTTFFIDLRRADPAAERIWEMVRRGEFTGAYSVLTVFELWVGRGITRTEEVFYEANFQLLEEAEVTSGIAQRVATWIRGIRASIPEALSRDALIAATAVARGEPIYTRNVRDMQRFAVSVVRY